ncbi:MAG: 30S ribosomal protein S12 methylthiotransferase RimO [Clostridia bacterium]|nr:30S ribosomal protein S12 methylthiotransferase RimO [Clostridia bacterium]
MTIKVGVVSLGCAKNLVDSEVMLGILDKANYAITGEEDQAEVLIVNTCGFIESAKQESINTILALAEHKQTGRCKVLILAGCLAQKYRDELARELPEVDAIVGTGEVENIAGIVEAAMSGGEKVVKVDSPEYLYDHNSPRIRTTPGYSAYVKVADGCDNCCSYCVIPELRGSYRSRPLESIEAEVKSLVEQGVKEVLLIAQDTTRYGIDIYGQFKLSELVERLSQIKDLHWIRLLYCYPTHFTEELISAMAKNPKVCKYLDIPLQHCDDEILQAMNRRGKRQDILDLIARLRKAMPDIVLRTSFIVGLPGETEVKFQALLDFIAEVRFDRAGIFTYSREPGTPAAGMENQVPDEVKEERYHRAMEALMQLSWEKNQARVGQTLEVLVEGKEENGHWFGRSQGDAPDIDGKVYFDGDNPGPGSFVQVRITEAYEYDLMGEVINEPS